MGWLEQWFGRKQAPEAGRVRPDMWREWGLMPAGDDGFVQGYARQVEEVFMANPVGKRVVRLIVDMLAGLPLVQNQGDARALRMIEDPELREAMACGLLLHGNAYAQIALGSDGLPARLYPVRPERVSVAVDERGWPCAYLVRGKGSPLRIAREDGAGRRMMVHARLFNPLGDVEGSGCLSAAVPAASVHNRAMRWNKALLDNAARPSGALTHESEDGANLSDDQFERLREELDRQFAGAANAGRPLLLDGGLRWQPLALSPAEMDFAALKESAARDVALAFGVPPVLIGLPGDATYANAREAGRALYRHSVLPMAAKLLWSLGDALSDWFGPVKFAVDLDAISELAEDRGILWQRLSEADFLSAAEKRVQLGFAPDVASEGAGDVD